MTRQTRAAQVLAAVALTTAALLGSGILPAAHHSAASASGLALAAADDTVVFRSGRIVKGEILEETSTTIKMRVVVAGIEAVTTYEKADILSIERGEPAPKPEDPDPAPAPAPRAGAAAPDRATDPATNADAASIYLVEVKGEFGHDVSITPMRDVLRDVKRHEPDVLVIKIDTEFAFYGNEIPDFVTGSQQTTSEAFNQLELARQLQVLLTDEIRDDSSWTQKPRVVFWVKRALGGSAFLPFVSPDIYYTSDGRHGGIGYLEYIFEGVGDEVAQEKQYSLRLARAEGLAIKGGHAYQIVRAMARADYVLSVSFVGGQPVYHEREPENPGEILLTDDGDEQAGRRDTEQDVVRYRGNDVLTLDAPMAQRLGLSRGTADTIDDLAFELGLGRGYAVVDGNGSKILEGWAEDVTQAEINIRRLLRELGRIAVQGDYDERTKARGQQIRILREILSLLERFGESINPYEIEGLPEDWKTRLRLQIAQIEQEQRRDRR